VVDRGVPYGPAMTRRRPKPDFRPQLKRKGRKSYASKKERGELQQADPRHKRPGLIGGINMHQKRHEKSPHKSKNFQAAKKLYKINGIRPSKGFHHRGKWIKTGGALGERKKPDRYEPKGKKARYMVEETRCRGEEKTREERK